jgi:RNA polymerase sigma-B factor
MVSAVSELLDDESAQQDAPPPRVRSVTPRWADGHGPVDGQRHGLSRLDPAALWEMRDRDARGPARDELARRYLPLARKLAARYANPNEPLEDLMQVASLGLLKAIDRYSPERGTPFSSFAVPTILGELKRHFRDTGWSVHVPRDAKELALRVDRASREMAGRLGRSPQVDELAQFLELSVEDVVAALEAANAHFGASLDAPASASDPDAGPLVEMLGSEDDGFSLAETALDLGAATSTSPLTRCIRAPVRSSPRSGGERSMRRSPS